MGYQNPVIVIPGITASDLHDDYPLKTETLWSMVFNKDFDNVLNQTFEIDLVRERSGIYILKAMGSTFNQSKKLFLNR